MAQVPDAGIVAVFDVGKTNIKLSAVTRAGEVLETLSTPNTVLPGPPWRNHDLASASDWLFSGLAALSKRHRLTVFVASGHGSGGVLTGPDPEAGNGSVLPMIDYEQALPPTIRDGYARLAGTFFERGSKTMHAATHQARQMYWMQEVDPGAFAKARWLLGVPQYWAWRLSGVATSEATFLGAQSHLWNVAERRWSKIVLERGWLQLMPPLAFAWQDLGPILPGVAKNYGLPPNLRILAGLHDSSANFYRYQAAGFANLTVVSTGTWVVGLSSTLPISLLDEHRGMTLNADVYGAPLGGVLTMAGREFTTIAGESADTTPADVDTIDRLVVRGTMALPTFGGDDGLFPGTAGQGRIVGPAIETPAERKALAVLHAALLTTECLDSLHADGQVVLDGPFVRDPAYTALVAALFKRAEIWISLDAYGVASGAALLVDHQARTSPAPIRVTRPDDLTVRLPSLAGYAARWRSLASSPTKRSVS
jgi:sugar (pentulose or hexulose) kinase